MKEGLLDIDFFETAKRFTERYISLIFKKTPVSCFLLPFRKVLS
jgi:hypothetical protein